MYLLYTLLYLARKKIQNKIDNIKTMVYNYLIVFGCCCCCIEVLDEFLIHPTNWFISKASRYHKRATIDN